MDPTTEILIDGRFLCQAITGVQRVAREIVRELDRLLCTEDLPAQFTLAYPAGANVAALGLRKFRLRPVNGGQSHMWEQVALAKAAEGQLLLCLGNSSPVVSLLSWPGSVVAIHDVSFLSMPKAYKLHYRLAHRLLLPLQLRRARLIITVSQIEKERLARLLPDARKRIIVAQNGAWPDDRIFAAEPCEGYALYVGSLSLRKNADGVIRTAIKLAREDGIRTVILGSGSTILTPLSITIPDDVKHLIEFVGATPDLDTLGRYYRRAACLVFPSFHESSPLPPLEAMSNGCPVIASAIPSMTERCGDAAIYCNPHDIDDIARAVRKLMADPELAETMRQRGYERARGFTWASQARLILSALTAIAASQGDRTGMSKASNVAATANQTR